MSHARALLSAWLRADRAFGRIPHASVIGHAESLRRTALLGSARLWAKADLWEWVRDHGDLETRLHLIRIGPYGGLSGVRLRRRGYYRVFLEQFGQRRIA